MAVAGTYWSLINPEAFPKGPDADRTHGAKNQRHRPVAQGDQKVSKDQDWDSSNHQQHVVAEGTLLIGVDVPILFVAIHPPMMPDLRSAASGSAGTDQDQPRKAARGRQVVGRPLLRRPLRTEREHRGIDGHCHGGYWPASRKTLRRRYRQVGRAA